MNLDAVNQERNIDETEESKCSSLCINVTEKIGIGDSLGKDAKNKA